MWLCPFITFVCPKNFSDVMQCRMSSYNVGILHLMAPMDFWQNSTPFLVRQLSVRQKLVIYSMHSAPHSALLQFFLICGSRIFLPKICW